MGKNNDLYLEYAENPHFEDEKSMTKKYTTKRLYTFELTDEQVENAYFNWLCEPISASDRSYKKLLTRLHSIEFTWFVPNDDNRGFDGEKLRTRFAEVYNIGLYERSVLFNRPCTVLELLIGLSITIEDIMVDIEESEHIDGWFWELIANLGLCEFSDDEYDANGGHIVVWKQVQKMLKREYGRNGDGGLFPLAHAKTDQRKVELWYQLNSYLIEKYHADGEE